MVLVFLRWMSEPWAAMVPGPLIIYLPGTGGQAAASLVEIVTVKTERAIGWRVRKRRPTVVRGGEPARCGEIGAVVANRTGEGGRH